MNHRSSNVLLVHLFCYSLPLCAQMEITTVGEPVGIDFNVAGNPDCSADVTWTNNATIPHCYTDRTTYNYSDGCANHGGLHIAGTNGETALGGRSSNSMSSFRWGVRFKNGTGVALGGIHVQVRAEQWGQAVSNAQNVVQFAYRAGATAITDVVSGSYVNEPALNLTNFTAPSGCSGSNSAINGNSTENSALLEACLPVTLQAGDEIMLRWYDVNDPCNDHMLCIDDLVVTGLPMPELTADGPTEVCEGGSVVLSVEGAEDVAWSTGGSGLSLTVTEPGIYTATCTTACGSVITLTEEIAVADAPAISVTPGDSALCPGATLELIATSNAGGLLWSTGETTNSIIVDGPGSYTVTTTSSCGTAQASVTITADEMPSAVIAAEGGTTFCTGTETTLVASGGTTYDWTNGTTGAQQVVSAAGTFTVNVSNACGTDQASITLTEIDAPSVEVSASASVLCTAGSVVLTATGGEDLVWSTGATASSITITSPGTYTVNSTNECGTASASVLIADGSFDASFTATPTEGTAPLEVSALEDIEQSVAIAWDMDNGTTSTDPIVTTTYTAPGTYTITLVATDANTGCTATTSMEILVEPGLSWVRMPNVFTPNGDGSNDGLHVEYEALASLHCSILNRWGQEVGDLKHPDDVWSGRDMNGSMPEGTYYYVLTAVGMDGTEHRSTGSITLLR